MEFFLLGIVLLLLIGVPIIFGWLRRKKLSQKDRAFVKNQWVSIEANSMHDPKHAIIEADKLFDFILKKKGYRGSFGEKLKKACGLFSNLDAIWRAHKLRNRIAHEVGATVSAHEATSALSAFRYALKDLGIDV